MCNLYRMEDKDQAPKVAQDAESLINLMPANQMNFEQRGSIVRNTAEEKTQLIHAHWDLPSPIFIQKKAAAACADNKAKARASTSTRSSRRPSIGRIFHSAFWIALASFR